MVLYYRHSKGNNTVLTPRIESAIEVTNSSMVATSLWFLITDKVKGLTPFLTPSIETTLEQRTAGWWSPLYGS
jgi:hypothetical protein